MLKDQLINEAKNIDASVELDSIFESVELSDEVKQNFATVFETTVKQNAIKLAESHINAIAEKSDILVEEAVDAKVKDIEEKFLESADKFLEHVSNEWLQENKVAIDRGIKADLFESMFTSIKAVIVEHNVELPEESVDVVAELEEELQENKQEVSKLFATLNETTEELTNLKRTNAIDKAVADLAESQKEKVHSLIEGLEYGDKFEEKLNAIVAMSKNVKEVTNLTENVIVDNDNANNVINNNNNDASGLNYVVESVEDQKQPTQTKDKSSQYVAAAKLIK